MNNNKKNVSMRQKKIQRRKNRKAACSKKLIQMNQVQNSLYQKIISPDMLDKLDTDTKNPISNEYRKFANSGKINLLDGTVVDLMMTESEQKYASLYLERHPDKEIIEHIWLKHVQYPNVIHRRFNPNDDPYLSIILVLNEPQNLEILGTEPMLYKYVEHYVFTDLHNHEKNHHLFHNFNDDGRTGMFVPEKGYAELVVFSDHEAFKVGLSSEQLDMENEQIAQFDLSLNENSIQAIN